MKSDYMIEHVQRDGKVKYGVYRLKDISLPDTEDNREYAGVYEDYETAFKRAYLIDRSKKYPRWTSVKERLPEDGTYVLTTIKIPGRKARVRSGNYYKGVFHNDNGDSWMSTDMEVLAWMPIPKPYKEGQQ